MKNAFAGYHPAVSFTYFVLVSLLAMLFLSPYLLAVSLPAAFLYSLVLRGGRAAKFGVTVALPLLVLVSAVNPLFVHDGFTVLFYLSDNPVTLEALVYGAAASAAVVTVLFWFMCYNEVVTTDKFLFLFGRLIPSIALLISMTLRLIPRLKLQITAISHAQRGIGMDASAGSLRQRARHGMKILSILMSWALENGLETADSMKARGYGIGRRSTFSLFRFTARDAAVLAVLLISFAVTTAGCVTGAVSFQFYPVLGWPRATPMLLCTLVSYAVLCLLPCAITVWEDIKWRCSLSKI